jgi:glycosyltransferase involved in cell wall biosynthesis
VSARALETGNEGPILTDGGTLTRLSILMPVYNERRFVLEAIGRVLAVDLSPLGLERELIVVDDGSTDGTAQSLRALPPRSDVRVYYHHINQGKGAAVRTALFRATGELALIQDADLEYDPSEYPVLLEPIVRAGKDVVYGSRFLGAGQGRMLLSHMLGNKALTLLTNLLYGCSLTDMETCYKVFRTSAVRSLGLRSRAFEIEPEITAKLLRRGYAIYEVPISYEGRHFAEGKKITWRDGPRAAWTLVRYRLCE